MTIHVSLSGGLDSTASLLTALGPEGRGDVRAVSVFYGQRQAARELDAARRITKHLSVPHSVIDLNGLLHGSALLGETEVPHGHYAEDVMRQTVVLGRNLAFVSAIVCNCCEPGDEVWVGVHGGDHFIYPDCRPSFIDPLAELLYNAYDVTLVAPFVDRNKTDIAMTFAQHLDIAEATYSCYEGGELHCGRCGTCVERAEAFHLCGLLDPTQYADPDFWRTQV